MFGTVGPHQLHRHMSVSRIDQQTHRMLPYGIRDLAISVPEFGGD